MQWLGEDRLGFARMEDWCRITVQDFNDNNGAGLLAKYKGSPIAVLQAAYPQHAWQPHRFPRVGYSAVAIRWLSKHESTHGVSIQHAESSRHGEFKVPGTGYKVDGYCQATNTVYEFLGSLWHGDPGVYDAPAYNGRLS
jgi:hypothetical protein